MLADAGLEVAGPGRRTGWSRWSRAARSSTSSGAPAGIRWRRDLIERAEVLPVLSVQMPVLAATDIVVTKLMALDEHYCDFARLLPVARALREQVDWDAGAAARWPATTSPSSFLELLDRLGVVVAVTAADAAGLDGAPGRGMHVRRRAAAANLSAERPRAAVVPRPRAGPASERLRDPTCPPARSSGSTRRRVSASSRARTARTSSCTRTPSRPGRRSSSRASAWSSASSPARRGDQALQVRVLDPLPSVAAAVAAAQPEEARRAGPDHRGPDQAARRRRRGPAPRPAPRPGGVPQGRRRCCAPSRPTWRADRLGRAGAVRCRTASPLEVAARRGGSRPATRRRTRRSRRPCSPRSPGRTPAGRRRRC